MRKSLRTLSFLSAILLFSLGSQRASAQSAKPVAQPAGKPQAPRTPATTPPGPSVPQSTHYPILLLAFGSDPGWSLRVGQKGPERLDRTNYPPIVLEPAEVTHESGADSWTYHAKDTATGATLVLRLSREACSGPTPPVTPPTTTANISPAASASGKFTFRATVEHSQIGTLTGCGRIAAELFPKINNQPTDDDIEAAKNKVPVSTVTNAKAPVAVAFINSAHKLVFKRAEVVKVVAQDGYQASFSHDGKRLLFTHDEKGGDRTLSLYDFATGRSSELLRGQVQQAFWSLDDSRVAFLKNDGAKWRLFLMPVNAPDRAAQIYSGEIVTLHGWTDSTTILADDLNNLLWIEEGGGVKQTVSTREIYGDGSAASSANKVEVHPLNPDLLLVSAEAVKPATDIRASSGLGFFLYEVRSKRRVTLNTPNLTMQSAEWSRDGFQIFFTGTDSGKRSSTYRIFWDGIGLRRYIDGTNLIVGQ